MSGLRVAVVGGGVGGVTTALALAQHGVEVAVHERRDAVHPLGSGLGLATNGRRVLTGLGLGPALDAVGAPIPAMRLLGADGTEVARYDIGPGGLLGMRRADLLRVLVDWLPPGVLHLGRECVAVEPGRPGHGPRVQFADGTDERPDVVVAADGIHSRSVAVVTAAPALRPSGTSALRTFVDARDLPPTLRCEQNAWLGPDRHLLAYPVDRAGTVNVAAFLPTRGDAAEDWSFRVDPEVVRAAFAGWSPDVAAILDRAREVYRFDLADRDPVAPWSHGGVVLLGDAAHPMLPHMGQGANQAIEDAAVLAALLAAVDDPADVPTRLAAYQEERRPRTARIQEQSRRNGERFSSGSGESGGSDLSWVHAYDAPAVGRAAAARL